MKNNINVGAGISHSVDVYEPPQKPEQKPAKIKPTDSVKYFVD